MSTRKLRHLWLAVSPVCLIACASSPLELEMSYNTGTVDQSFRQSSRVCVIRINHINDVRSNKLSLGSVGSSPVYGKDAINWIRRGMDDLNPLGYRTVTDRSALDHAVDLEVYLKRLYIRSVHSTIESVVQLDIRYLTRNGQSVERNYRGSHVKINWSSSNSDVMSSFNNSMSQVVHDIAKDLVSLCDV